MKYIQLAVLVGTLTLAGCAGDSAKKNADTASKQASTPSTTRCPPGYLADNIGNCVPQQQTSTRSTPVRDSLGRPMGQGVPTMSVPSSGGLLGR